MACARLERLCGAVRAYKQIDIKEPRQAVNLSGVSCVITNASGGGCGASSSLQAVAPLRGCTWVYCKVASLPGSCNTLDHIGAGFRTLEALKYYGCLACCGFLRVLSPTRLSKFTFIGVGITADRGHCVAAMICTLAALPICARRCISGCTCFRFVVIKSANSSITT